MESSSGRLRWALRTGAWEPTPDVLEFLLACLSPDQRALVVRHSRAEDRKRALAARFTERAAAAAALGLPLGAVALKRTRGGKPYVTNDVPKPQAPNWNFSVSHEVRRRPGAGWRGRRPSAARLARLRLRLRRLLPAAFRGPPAEAPLPALPARAQGDYVILASEPLAVCGCDVAAPQAVRRPGAPPQPLRTLLRPFERQLTRREWETVWGARDEAAQEEAFR